MEAESSCERTGTNGTRKYSLNKENSANDRGPVFSREERLLNNDNDRQPSDGMKLIAMEGHDRTLLHESSRRFDNRPIVIVRLRFVIIL